MAASNRFYSWSRPSLVPTTQDATTNPDLRRLTSVEAAVHVLQQQQSGASAQLSDFSSRLDIFEDRIGRQIADALAERDVNVPRYTCRSRGKVPREVSVSCWLNECDEWMIVCLLLGNFQQSFVLQKPLVVCRNSAVANVHCHAVSVLM